MSLRAQRSIGTLRLTLLLMACAAQSAPQPGEVGGEEAARIAEEEGVPAETGRPAPRCDGVWDCTKTIFTDFVYLPVNVARGMGSDVQTYREQKAAAPATEEKE